MTTKRKQFYKRSLQKLKKIMDEEKLEPQEEEISEEETTTSTSEWEKADNEEIIE